MANAFQDIWPEVSKPVIGMVHLPPLPGSPRFAGDLAAVRDAAVRDANTLAAGGVDGIMVENFGDAPFFAGRVPAHTVAHLTAVAGAVRQAVELPIGVNVLRNDARSALAIAHAIGAAYIRVNVLVGAAVTDQGVIEGEAAVLLRERAALGAGDVRIFADVRVKHAAPLVTRPIEEEIDELIDRAAADAIIASGAGTGRPTDVVHLQQVKTAAGDTPVLVGSGATADTLEQLAPHADGFIVGSALKPDGDVSKPVDIKLITGFMDKARSLQ